MAAGSEETFGNVKGIGAALCDAGIANLDKIIYAIHYVCTTNMNFNIKELRFLTSHTSYS